jgi:hypothetical protein
LTRKTFPFAFLAAFGNKETTLSGSKAKAQSDNASIFEKHDLRLYLTTKISGGR